jgi:hypothetical protein
MRAIARFVAAERSRGTANDRGGKFNVRYRTDVICINVAGLSRPQIYFSPGIEATMPRYGKGQHNDGRIFTAQSELTSDHAI